MENKITALNSLHKKYGAKLVSFAGYEMPIQYSKGIIEEHKSTRENAGIFDVSHMGQLFIKGNGLLAEDLEKIFPVELKNCKINQSKYSFLMNDEAGIHDDLIITKVDMVPAQFVAGISCCIIGFLLSEKIMISPHDIFLGFVAGFFQVGFGFIFITIGARTTPSAMVGIIMLSESILGPLWAFLFVSERPSMFTLIGGVIILFAVLLQFYSLLSTSKKKITN